METVEKSITVNVPVSTAYNQWTQFEEFPRFMSGVQEVRQEGDTHLFWKANIADTWSQLESDGKIVLGIDMSSVGGTPQPVHGILLVLAFHFQTQHPTA